MLDKFRFDILDLILNYIRDLGDLKSLRRVSKALSTTVVPKIYTSIAIPTSNEEPSAIPNVGRFMRNHHNPNNYLEYAKNLEFVATFHTRMWKLGTCVPLDVLFYLTECQRKLESLTITTDPTCWEFTRRRFPPEFFGILQLPALRRFHYTGVVDMIGLGDFLNYHAHRVEELELEFMDDVDSADVANYPENYFARDCLRLRRKVPYVLFPSLKTASLIAVSFLRVIAVLSHSLNLHQLRTLKLRNCRGSNDLLRLLAGSPDLLHLTSFEFQKSFWFSEDTGLTALIEFLESFRGLEKLFLFCNAATESFSRDVLSPEYWASISCHHATLRKLVHHQREVVVGLQDDEDPLYPSDLPASYYQIIDLVGNLSLTHMGLCCSPVDMAIVLSEVRNKPHWQVLHIRSAGEKLERPADPLLARNMPFTALSGPNEHMDIDGEELSTEFNIDSIINPDFASSTSGRKSLAKMPSAPMKLLSFAQWAFGPTGLLDLQVLAYGDFSHNGRHEWQNWLFCRTEFGHKFHKYRADSVFEDIHNAQLTFQEVDENDWRL